MSEITDADRLEHENGHPNIWERYAAMSAERLPDLDCPVCEENWRAKCRR